jgi:GDP-L-fucose synthase
MPSITCWGTGSATREFLYVEDAADAIVRATATYNENEPINVGSGYEITIKDLTELIASLTNYTGQILWDPTKPDGQPRRCLNTAKAKEFFNFTATTQLEHGLQKTITWYEQTQCT